MMAQAPGVNPLFQGVPRRNWQLSQDPEELVVQHGELWVWIVQQLLQNNVGTFDVNHQGQDYSFRLLPNGGFFILDVLLPQGQARPENQPLPLLFSFHDLYLLGFSHDNVWYLFDDAILTGTGCNGQNYGVHWKKLGFSGRYRTTMFTTVLIGPYQLLESYYTLTKYRHDKHVGMQDLIQTALFIFIVSLPEAWRFPQWNERLHEILTTVADKVVNEQGTVDFGTLFRQWDKISNYIISGPDMFPPICPLVGFITYGDLLPALSVLLQ